MTTSFTIDGNALIWTGDGETLRIEPWEENSVRVRATRNRGFGPVDWALLEPKNESGRVADIAVGEDGEHASLTNGSITVKADSNHAPLLSAGYETFRCDLSFWNAEGELLFREYPQGGSLLLKARDYTPVSGESFAVTTSFSADPKERLYGMGEYQQDVLDLKGSTFELAHRNSQASVPFVVSSKGYGFLWHNPAIGRATFGRNRTEWAAQSTDQIDYWVTAGDSYAQIESQYADATGHAPVMPEWGMGFWQCKLRYWNQEQLLDVARGFKSRNIPLDLIVIDFFHWPHLGDYKFEDEFWPDPEAMVAELNSMGVKLMVSVWPQVSVSSENFVEMKRNNYLVSAEAGLNLDMMFEEPCVNYDPTNPGARKFVWDKCKANYWDKGVRAFWLDEAEPEYGVYDFRNYRYHMGSDLNVGNVYPQAYNRGFYEGQIEAGMEGEIVNLTRCAWAGSQRYGSLVWSGDVGSTFADLKSQITCAIHMGMAGIPWFTTDMGGFHDGVIDSDSFKELLARWCAFSCFLPVMRNHGDRSLGESTGKQTITKATGEHRSPSGADNEPWSYGPEMESIFRKYIAVREVMRPYTRELFQSAHEQGQPLVRGLFYEFPTDEHVADIADEYLYGPDILVAPVVEAGAASRSVYLPGDETTTWTDLRDGAVYVGGQSIESSAAIDTVPAFARDGRDHGLIGLL